MVALLTTQQAATELGVSAPRVRQLLAKGRIRGAFKLGKSWAIPDPVRVKPGGRGPEGAGGPRISREAGLYRQRRSRITGTTVSIYNARRAGFDPSAGPWAIVCEEHGAVTGVGSLVEAKRAAPSVAWCGVCQRQ